MALFVELIGRYSNQLQVLRRLSRLLALPTVEREPKRVARRRRYLSDDERLVIVEAYVLGSSTYALAKRFGINRQTVSAIVAQHGCRTRYRLLTPDDVEVAKRSYVSGCSLQSVADEFEVGITIVRTALL